MKNLVFAFALLCSTSLVAQFSYHVDENGVSGTGIQSPTNTASGVYSIAMGSSAQANGGYSTVIGTQSVATDIGSIAIGGGVNSDGLYSVGLGSSTAASGDYSMAMGYETQASGSSSTAMGRGTIASGYTSTAMGYQTQASGNDSTALGANTEASGIGSTAMGVNTTASGNKSTAMGGYTTASGDYSTAMGLSTIASGDYSTAMGESTLASGSLSTAMGFNTTARNYASLVIGQWNLAGSTTTNSPTEYSTDNTAFVIGNGLSWENRSDALTVLFDGTTTIAGDLSINSDARLKANIISLGSTLSKLLQIDGKSYTMKKDESEKQKIGVLAQDIEKVFPELVSESNGIKSVNYQGLVPVLINALKEQEERIKRLEELLLD